ncbi:MAG: TonB-dependent receptor plug domain-containing protein, partial [Flavobacterium sp.]
MKKKLNRYIWLCVLLISIGIKAQETKPLIQSKLEGIVVDAITKEPIIGASINIKGTTHGVVTDFDGKFFFQTGQKLPYTLLVSYLGYKKTEVVANTNSVVIELTQEQNALSEVVVTALGITKEKKSLGYTTQALKGKELSDTKETNFLNSLTGKLAGVRITNSQGDMGSSRIIIRGETSISGNNQPLFVVDGVPVDNSQLNFGGATRDFKNAIADLNPNDIETLTVLKGPNAAALYGSRAAHGVVLITTKSGKGQKGLGINFSTGITISQVSTLPSFQNTFGQGSNGKFSYVDGKGGGVNDGVDESWGPKMDGRLIP